MWKIQINSHCLACNGLSDEWHVQTSLSECYYVHERPIPVNYNITALMVSYSFYNYKSIAIFRAEVRTDELALSVLLLVPYLERGSRHWHQHYSLLR